MNVVFVHVSLTMSYIVLFTGRMLVTELFSFGAAKWGKQYRLLLYPNFQARFEKLFEFSFTMTKRERIRTK